MVYRPFDLLKDEGEACPFATKFGIGRLESRISVLKVSQEFLNTLHHLMAADAIVLVLTIQV
jgi:hypothetical protein